MGKILEPNCHSLNLNHVTFPNDENLCIRCGYVYSYYYGGHWHPPDNTSRIYDSRYGDYPSFKYGSGDTDYSKL